MSIILSSDNECLSHLPYKIGDKFLLESTLETYDEEMKEALGNHQVIIEIESIELFENTEIGYRLKFIKPSYDWKWTVTMDILEEDFIPLKKNLRDSRFLMLE